MFPFNNFYYVFEHMLPFLYFLNDDFLEFKFFHIFMRRIFFVCRKMVEKRHCSINFTYLKQKPNVKVLFISLFICKVFASEKYGSISKTSGYFWRSFFSLQFRRKSKGWREGEAAVVLEKIEMKWVHAVERFVFFFFSFLFFLFLFLFFLFCLYQLWWLKS